MGGMKTDNSTPAIEGEGTTDLSVPDLDKNDASDRKKRGLFDKFNGKLIHCELGHDAHRVCSTLAPHPISTLSQSNITITMHYRSYRHIIKKNYTTGHYVTCRPNA